MQKPPYKIRGHMEKTEHPNKTTARVHTWAEWLGNIDMLKDES